jgi:hypothetical protein
LEKEVAKLAKVGEAKRPRVFIDRNEKQPRAWPDGQKTTTFEGEWRSKMRGPLT